MTKVEESEEPTTQAIQPTGNRTHPNNQWSVTDALEPTILPRSVSIDREGFVAVWCERHIMAYDAFDVMKLVMWLKSVQEIGTKYKTAGTTHYQSSLFMSLEHHAWCSWICDALALVSAKLCWMWSMKWVTVTTRTKETSLLQSWHCWDSYKSWQHCWNWCTCM